MSVPLPLLSQLVPVFSIHASTVFESLDRFFGDGQSKQHKLRVIDVSMVIFPIDVSLECFTNKTCCNGSNSRCDNGCSLNHSEYYEYALDQLGADEKINVTWLSWMVQINKDFKNVQKMMRKIQNL